MDSEHDDEKPLERVQSANLTARVPDGVAVGVFATGAIVLQSPTEVMIDFVQAVANPRRIGVRVVMPPGVAVQFAEALQSNLGIYEQTFGRQPREPQPVASPEPEGLPREAPEDSAAGSFDEGGRASADQSSDDDQTGDLAPREDASRPASSAAAAPPIADAYDQLKVTDAVLGGAYANTVTISHTGSEFHFDFINRCFPRSIVNARVYMAAPRAPALLDSLKRSLRLG
jgi:hypothetical protein